MLAFEHKSGGNRMHRLLGNNGLKRPVEVHSHVWGKHVFASEITLFISFTAERQRWEKLVSSADSVSFEFKKIVTLPLGSPITWECLHFWHLVATGRGRPGRTLSSCWKMSSCTSSVLCSKYVTPNGTVVWTTREGPTSEDSGRRGTQRHTLKMVTCKCLSALQTRVKRKITIIR